MTRTCDCRSFITLDLPVPAAETADNRYEWATDTFVVQDGKIVAQSFAAKIIPRHMSA